MQKMMKLLAFRVGDARTCHAAAETTMTIKMATMMTATKMMIMMMLVRRRCSCCRQPPAIKDAVMAGATRRHPRASDHATQRHSFCSPPLYNLPPLQTFVQCSPHACALSLCGSFPLHPLLHLLPASLRITPRAS